MAKKSGSPKSATTKSATKKKPSAKKKPVAVSQSRTLKATPKKRFGFRQSKNTPLPSVWQLTRSSLTLLWQHRRLFVGIAAVYGLLTLALVKGFTSGSSISDIKSTVVQTLGGHPTKIATSLGTFSALLGAANSGASQAAGAYELFIFVIASLAVIWTLRQVMAGTMPRVRDAYYHGMYPLIPFVLILLIIAAQMLPTVIGSSIYNTVIYNNIAIHGYEKLLWAGFFIVTMIISLYMLTASLMALYIVTLPDMEPMKAWRTARGLVDGRRWQVMRKILYLPIAILVVLAAVMVPVITVMPVLAQVLFFVLVTSTLLVMHAYMYTLYRELINE